jgi:hypothetical protein
MKDIVNRFAGLDALRGQGEPSWVNAKRSLSKGAEGDKDVRAQEAGISLMLVPRPLLYKTPTEKTFPLPFSV